MEIIDFPWSSSAGMTGFIENQVNQLNVHDNEHFFSRYEADESDIKCYLGDNVALTIKQSSSYNPAQIIINDFSFSLSSSSYQAIRTAIVHDKGICLFFSSLNNSGRLYGPLMLITKKKNNQLVILFFDSSSPSAATQVGPVHMWGSSSNSNYSTDYIVVAFQEDGLVTMGKMTVGFQDAKYFNPQQTTKIYGFQAFDPTDGISLDDIFICTTCGIRNIEPSYIRVNETDYTGIYYNSILLKGK